MTSSNWRRWSILLLLGIYVILALSYSVINPLYEATDELRHYRYVRTIAESKKLPVQGEEPCRSQSHHPPLFYVLGALATFWIEPGSEICDKPDENPFWDYRYWEVGRDNKNQYLHTEDEAFPWYDDALGAHIVRGLNVLIGAGVVFLTWVAGRKIWPDRLELALGGAALVALNPMFLYMAGAINNDILAALAGAAVTYACVSLLLNPHGLSWRWGLIFGAVYGLALMSKLNLAVSILLIEAVFIWTAWKKHQWREWLIANLLVAAVAGFIAGWWFVRNQLLYGEPTGFQQVTQLWGFREPGESFGLAVSELPYAFSTLWGRFGFGQIPLPLVLYQGLFILVAAGLLGALIGFVRRSGYRERVVLAFLFANIILFFLVLFNYMLVSPAGPNGRFFFPALTALALLMIYGLSQLISLLYEIVQRLRSKAAISEVRETLISRYAGLTVSVGMLVLAVGVLLFYLGPAYARPASFTEDEELPNPVEIRFDQLATLRGYDVSETSSRPGGFLDIELYWEVNNQPPGNYLLFVHLLDENGAIIAQRDTHPGLGNFPASQWRPGDRFIEDIRLHIPETAYVPAKGILNVGLYAPDAFRLAVTDSDGKDYGDAYQISTIQLSADDGQFPNPQMQNFGNDIMLVGYEYDLSQLKGDGEILVTLYWKAVRDVEQDYVAQVRLQDNSGEEYAAADGRPGSEALSTSAWREGQIFEDPHRIFVDRGTPAGSYVVEIALLDTTTNSRQNIIAADGHWIDNRLLLASIRIAPP